jgi:hypothetical protein
MTEPTPQDPTDQRMQPASPETTFFLVKSLSYMGAETINHTDPSLLQDRRENDTNTMIYYESSDKCFGDLSEWNGRYFSYTDKKIVTPNNENSFSLEKNPHKSQGYPDGMILGLSFKVGSRVEIGEVYRRETAFVSEGPPLIRDLRRLASLERPPEVIWRPMTESEAQDLIIDIAELSNRLHGYLEANPGPLFTETE